jgi:hypothetical protein
MDLWGWVIAYIVGFSLLQVLIHRYLGDEDESDAGSDVTIERTGSPHEHARPESGSSPAATERQSTPTDPLSTAAAATNRIARSDRGLRSERADHTNRCPRCGTLNTADVSITYCRECVMPLE